MRIEQRTYSRPRGWQTLTQPIDPAAAQLVFLFGGRQLLEDASLVDQVRQAFAKAHVVVASTSGEIIGDAVTEDALAVTAVAFDRTSIECVAANIQEASGSYAAGCALAQRLIRADLVHVFVVSDGARVNGTELARGFNTTLPAGVALTGGLAGDGTRFEKTLVGLDETPVTGRIVAVGFYGSHLRIAFGSSGGWSPFGPERVVTRSSGNVLQALDGRSALQLYKTYLGEYAAHLPGSALRFPLAVTTSEGGPPVVRTILSIDEAAESMTFAGDIPEGARVRFMRASYEDLIDGAARAAHQIEGLAEPQLAICISCVGRRIVLGQRTEEETEIVRETLGPATVLTGFYSYGELAPGNATAACQLHNQTMTITSLRED
jgi:hypothetical protein